MKLRRGMRYDLVPAGGNDSLQRDKDFRLAGIDDGVTALAGDRADTAEVVFAVENVLDGMRMAQGLHGQQQHQQQDSQGIRFSVGSGHGFSLEAVFASVHIAGSPDLGRDGG